MNEAARISDITLDEGTIIRRAEEIEHERAQAIRDLLAENQFAPEGFADGPYRVRLAIEETRLRLDIEAVPSGKSHKLLVPLTPLRSLIRDYFMLCESYFDALKSGSRGRLESLDMGRRGLHNEGAEAVQALLKDKVTTDFDTARRLFTLICVLHIK